MEVLQKAYTYLKENLSIDSMVDILISHEVIDQQQSQKILQHGLTNAASALLMVDILMQKSLEDFQLFLTALEKNGQDFIAKHLKG